MKLDKVYQTQGINTVIADNKLFAMEVSTALSRYVNNDWGDMSDNDKAFNDECLKSGDQILAAYKTSKGKIYIITEVDRTITTILFASEY